MKYPIDYPLFQAALQQTYLPDYQTIIYGALKRLHIDYGHPLREDLVQEARLAMAKELVRLQENDTSVFGNAVGAHLYRRVNWLLLDALRHYQRDRLLFVHDDQTDWSINPSPVCPNRQEGHAFLQYLTTVLSPRQAEYVSWVMQDLPDTVIADKMGVSKQAIANLRARVIAKARRILKYSPGFN